MSNKSNDKKKNNKDKNPPKPKMPKPQSVAIGKSVSDSEVYSKTVEIREKRIGIVFKVIYVVAIFFAAVFVEMGKSFGKGLSSAYLIEVCAAAFLLMMLAYMVAYIINEMKCLKLTENDLPQRQTDATEKSYTNIFNYLYVAGATAMIGAALGTIFMESITTGFVAMAFLTSVIIWIALLSLHNWVRGNARDAVGFLCCFSATTMLIFLFLLPAISTVTENIPT